MNWRDRAACRNAVITPGADPWFPNGDEELTKTALAFCARCPVKRECLLEMRTLTRPIGVWGGKVHGTYHADRTPDYSPAETDARRLELYRQGLTDREIAAADNVTVAAISWWRRHRNLPINKSTNHRYYTLQERRKELHSWGWTDREIANREHSAVDAVERWRERQGLPPNPRRVVDQRTS